MHIINNAFFVNTLAQKLYALPYVRLKCMSRRVNLGNISISIYALDIDFFGIYYTLLLIYIYILSSIGDLLPIPWPCAYYTQNKKEISIWPSSHNIFDVSYFAKYMFMINGRIAFLQVYFVFALISKWEFN